MPTSEDDVLDLMNRAALDPPPMHLGPRSVLASAQMRRRHRRLTQAGMACAFAALATTLWLGLGSDLRDVLGDDLAPATPIEWDEALTFETELPLGDSPWQGFVNGSLVREPGAGFTVELPYQGSTTVLQPVEGDLPAGVSLFTNGGFTLVVSEPRFEGRPALDAGLNPWLQEAQEVAVSASGGDGTEVYMWWINSVLEPADVQDVYWALPHQVVTSTGRSVLNEVIEAGSEEIPIMIIPDSGRWATRSQDGVGLVHTVGDNNAVVSDDDLWVAVLPGDAANPAETITTRVVGDFQLAWAPFEFGDLEEPYGMWNAWLGPTQIQGEIPEAQVTALLNGRFDIGVSDSRSSLTIDPINGTPRGIVASDGSVLAVGPTPELEPDAGGRFPLEELRPDVLIQTDDEILTGWDFAPSSRPLQLPEETAMIGVVLPPGSITDPRAEVLPTLLFDAPGGPQWAGQGAPVEVRVESANLRVAVDRELGLWAINCEGSMSAQGRVGSAEAGDVLCEGDSGTSAYSVMVLPSSIAATARAISTGPGIDPDVAHVGEPITVELDDGLVLWAVPLGFGDDVWPDRAIAGIDLDGDGTADEARP